MLADFTHPDMCAHITLVIFNFFVVSLFIMVRSAFEPGPCSFDDRFVGHNSAEMNASGVLILE